jgi:hypothetical protein
MFEFWSKTNYQKLCGFSKIKEGDTFIGCPPFEIYGSELTVSTPNISPVLQGRPIKSWIDYGSSEIVFENVVSHH